LFGIGGWEFILIAVLALLLFGPDKLPQFARTLGRFMRDFKRYQDLMESTIRAEVFANDPTVKKDAFQTGKEFRERVGGGGFRRQKPGAQAEETAEPEAGAEAVVTDETAAAEASAASEEVVPAEADTPAAPDDESAAEATPAATEGEGEQSEA